MASHYERLIEVIQLFFIQINVVDVILGAVFKPLGQYPGETKELSLTNTNGSVTGPGGVP